MLKHLDTVTCKGHIRKWPRQHRDRLLHRKAPACLALCPVKSPSASTLLGACQAWWTSSGAAYSLPGPGKHALHALYALPRRDGRAHHHKLARGTLGRNDPETAAATVAPSQTMPPGRVAIAKQRLVATSLDIVRQLAACRRQYCVY